KLVDVWFKLQLSHHGGKYSIERLLALDEYTRTTSTWRVLFVCVATPLPMIALVLAQECIPLQQPADGWRANYGLWIRSGILSAVVTHGMAVHATYMLDGLALSLQQLALLTVCVSVGYTAAAMLIAAQWTFPIPFMGISLNFILIVLFAGWFRLIVGSRIFHQTLSQKRKLLRLIGFVSAQVLMAVIYPAYQVLFDAVTDVRYVLPVILLLPFIKLIMKNLLSLSITHMEDMMPEAVTYTVDFFNALYISTCMQSTSSPMNVIAIMAVDFAQTTLELHELHRSTRGILGRLRQVICTGSDSGSLLTAVRSLCLNYKILESKGCADIRVASCLPYRTRIGGKTQPKSSGEIPHEGPRVSCLEIPLVPPVRIRTLASGCKWAHRVSTTIHPISIAKLPDSHPRSPEAQQIGDEVRPTLFQATQEIGVLRETLEVLYTAECVILAEYLEFIIPMVYGCFMLATVQLPSAQYHTELANVTRHNVGGTVRSVFIYALLELASFVILAILMQRNCGIRALYHLAFVLETQMSLVQCKQMVWILMTMAFRVVHFGRCFNQLEWFLY
ncbi:hypothetical protein BBJ28_00021931, partial [Nothophytophthora sp. Chile5]